jgi:hypothetical protein
MADELIDARIAELERQVFEYREPISRKVYSFGRDIMIDLLDVQPDEHIADILLRYVDHLERAHRKHHALRRVLSQSAWDCERRLAAAMRILNAVDPDEVFKAMEELDDEGT